MNIKRWKKWFIAIIFITFLVFGLSFIKFSQIQAAIAFANTFPEPSASIKSTYATNLAHTQVTKVIGQIEATKNLIIRNEYAGIITFVGFKPGEVVKRDQILLKVDTRVDQANLKAAKATLLLAEKTHQRLTALLKESRVSQDEVDKAFANVSIAQAEIDQLETVIEKKEIRAPFTGRVDLTQFQVGQLLDVNSQITSLIGLDDTIWVNFAIPQTLPQLDLGENVSVSLTSNNEHKKDISAQVIAKHSSINANSRQQNYRASLDNSQGHFIHNQIVNVYVPVEQRDVVMVPTNAVTRSHFGDFVYQLVKDQQGDFRAQPVKVILGEKIADMQVILSGLSGGELIASEGAFKLKENLLVYSQLPETSIAGGMIGVGGY